MGLGGRSPSIEGIPGARAATCPDENAMPFSNMSSLVATASQPAAVGSRVRRGSKKKKNGNWIDAQLASALDAFDNGMNMKHTSEQFHIPYSSFREHCYGMR
jgi:hypothetical protein